MNDGTDRPRTRPQPPPGATAAGPPRAGGAVAALLRPLELLFDRLYGSRFNPLHQSGNLAVLCFLVTLVTGIYLFLFYRIGDPHGSVARIEESIFLGGWVRSVHRYSADLAMVAIVVHLLRKLVQGHTWGPRAFAWLSGVALLGVVLASGWTGLVLVWDVQGALVASQGARLLDLLPVLATPLGRSFNGETPVPSSFFFMNLFLHVALPLGLAAGLWIHVSRVARPALLPPRRLLLAVLALLALFAAIRPVVLPPAADLLALPGPVPLDLLFAFWLPVSLRVPPAVHLALWVVAFLLLAALTRFWRPRSAINVSWVDENSCTGCTDCYQDCPYEAIAMVPRAFGAQTSELVAHVDPARCVGCGLCAAACAPMGVGPFGRTGRDQLATTREKLAARPPGAREVVVLACLNGLGGRPQELLVAGARLEPVACAGSVHSATIELLVRGGAGGVVLLACPTRDCRFREGPKWLEARLFAGREAALKPRVDRRRIAFAACSLAEGAAARAVIAALRDRVAALGSAAEESPDLEAECAATGAAPAEADHG